MKKTGAIIVAAGLSSRMHDFKPLLPFADSTIATHNVEMLQNVGLNPVVVVTGYRADELEKHLSGTGARFVRNENFRTTEMFDSVKLGIKEIINECQRILIIPMDIPAIQDSTYRKVLSVDAPIVRTKYRDKAGHPIVIDRDTAIKFLAYSGENGLKGAVRTNSIPPVDIEVLDDGVNRDVDTPDDYLELIKWEMGI